MLYGPEVIGLMQPHPGRRFRMAQLVGYAVRTGRADAQVKAAARQAIRRVLVRLQRDGFVGVEAAGRRGAGDRYYWLPRSATASAGNGQNLAPALALPKSAAINSGALPAASAASACPQRIEVRQEVCEK